jgi:hypothetical protein
MMTRQAVLISFDSKESDQSGHFRIIEEKGYLYIDQILKVNLFVIPHVGSDMTHFVSDPIEWRPADGDSNFLRALRPLNPKALPLNI